MPSCAKQARRMPRDFKTVIGIIGSLAKQSSVRRKMPKRKKEATIGCQSNFGNESPKRKLTSAAV